MMIFREYFDLTLENFDNLDPEVKKSFSQLMVLDPELANRFLKAHDLKMKGKELDLTKQKTLVKAAYYEELNDLIAYKRKQPTKRKLSGVIQ